MLEYLVQIWWLLMINYLVMSYTSIWLLILRFCQRVWYRPQLPKLTTGSFPAYTKDLAIILLFPYQTHWDVSKKLMITSLSLKDRILHFFINKMIFLHAINFTHIAYNELFYMWAIEKQMDFNFPYLILKYLYNLFY